MLLIGRRANGIGRKIILELPKDLSTLSFVGLQALLYLLNIDWLIQTASDQTSPPILFFDFCPIPLEKIYKKGILNDLLTNFLIILMFCHCRATY